VIRGAGGNVMMQGMGGSGKRSEEERCQVLRMLKFRTLARKDVVSLTQDGYQNGGLDIIS